MQCLILLCDVPLRRGIQRRVLLQVPIDLVLHGLRSEGIPGLIFGQSPVGQALQLRVWVEDIGLGLVRSAIIGLATIVRPVPVALHCLRGRAYEGLIVGLELVVCRKLQTRGAGVHRDRVGGQSWFFIVRRTANALLFILVFAEDAASDRWCEVGPGWLDPAYPKGGHQSYGLGGMVPAAPRMASAHRQTAGLTFGRRAHRHVVPVTFN